MHQKAAIKKIFALLSLLSIPLAFNGCGLGYMTRAAYEEGKILANRQDIKSIIARPDTTKEDRDKLDLVLRARQFAIDIGLEPGGSFTKFTRIDRDILAWVFLASKRDSFELYTWWYPIVGRVPYRGFFELDDAKQFGESLSSKGYESSIRPTEAFSTLGWFDDPVLSTSLKHPKTRLANTVIHESFHGKVWVPGRVDFNESAANFVGSAGAAAFFAAEFGKCPRDCAELESLKNESALEYSRELEIADSIEGLYAELEALYKSAAPSEQKLAARGPIFEKHISRLRTKYPAIKLLREVNNAELIQLKLYLSDLRKFAKLFEVCGKDWSLFVDKISEIKTEAAKDSSKNPFEILDGIILKSK